MFFFYETFPHASVDKNVDKMHVQICVQQHILGAVKVEATFFQKCWQGYDVGLHVVHSNIIF